MNNLMYHYRCELERVVDGDTVELTIHLGFFAKLHRQRIRLKGIDAPEINTREGREAANYLGSLLAYKTLEIETTTDKRTDDKHDSFGRWLGTMWAVDPVIGSHLNVNLAMVDTGHAVKYTA